MPPGSATAKASNAAECLLQLSFTGSFLVRRVRLLQNARCHRRLLLGLGLDLALGLCVGLFVAKAFPPDRMVQMLMRCIDAVVTYLRMLILWLMDAPAGLKLNSVLSGALGKFFLYHIHLWVTFLQLSAPFVSRGLTDYMTALTWLGLGMQVAVAQDTLNLITFHVHCFYAYARRLFLSQTSGLLSLWRLFLGKKYNPLRKRVDSSAHDVDQLFVGTVAFTILLFLYPTTLMYFAVFKILELVLTAVQGAASFITHSVASIAETGERDS